MLRSVARLALPLPNEAAIHKANRVSRILGCGNKCFSSIMTFTNIMKPKGNDGVALIGRAMAFLAAKDAKSALGDVSEALQTLTVSPGETQLVAMGTALKARLLSRRLAEEEAKLQVAGGTTAEAVAQLRKEVGTAYGIVQKGQPDCWAAMLAQAELGVAEPHKIPSILDEVEARVKAEIQKGVDTKAELAHPLETFFCNRMFQKSFVESVKKSVKSDAIADAFCIEEEGLKADLEQLKGKYGEKLTDEEVGAIAWVVAEADIGHHYYELFPHELYRGHSSNYSQTLINKMHQFICSHPATGSIAESIAAMQKPEKPHPHPKKLTKTLDKIDVNADFIEQIDKMMKNDITPSADVENACKAIADSTQHTDLVKLGDELLEQVLMRVRLGRALAMECMGKPKEAAGILDELVAEDKFIGMWQVYVARSRINEARGLVDLADADSKKLFQLKKEHSKVDLPQFEAHSKKNPF